MNTTLCVNLTNVTSCHSNSSGSFPRGFTIDKDVLAAYNLFLYLMISLGVPGNFLVIVVFVKHPPSTSTDWFLLFITTFDFISSLVHTPIYVTFTNGVWKLYSSDVICKLHMLFSQAIILSSSFLICGLALDRYFKVCRPNSRLVTKINAKRCCIVISVVMFLLSIPTYTIYENVNGTCKTISMHRGVFAYYFMVFLSFVLATLTFIVAYVNVARTIIGSEKNVRRHGDVGGTRKHDFGWCLCWFCKGSCMYNRVEPSYASSLEGTNSCKVQTQDGHMGLRSERSETNSTEAAATANESKGNVSNRSVTNNDESCSTNTNRLRPKFNIFMVFRPERKPKEMSVVDRKNVSLRTTKIAFFVCSIFVITWIPPWVCFFIATSPKLLAKRLVIHYMMFGRMTYLLNNVANPILYTGMNRKFRMHVKRILSCS